MPVYFKNNKLYDNGTQKIIIYEQWPELRAYEINKNNGNFRHYMPKSSEFNIKRWRTCQNKTKCRNLGLYRNEEILFLSIFYPNIIESQNNRKLYTDKIPANVRAAVNKYNENNWHLLTFIRRTNADHAIELIKSNPMLGLALSSVSIFNNNESRVKAMRKLMRKKRAEMLEYMGFPAEKYVLRLFSRIHKSDRYVKTLLHLRNVLQLNDRYYIKRLKHMDEICKSVLYMMEYNIESITGNFISDFLNYSYDERNGYNRILRDTVNMMEITGIEHRKLRTVEEMIRLHDELVLEMDKFEAEQKDIKFPAHPYEGNEYVEPIRDYSALKHYANKLNNCAISYLNRIVKRKLYMYSVDFNGHLAMFSLIPSGDDYRISELSGINNKEVNEELYFKVRKWYYSNYLGITE